MLNYRTVVRKRVDVIKIERTCVACGWPGRPNFFVVGDIPGLPSIMFVDIHVERAHVNERCEKLTEILTRTGLINVYFTDIQFFLMFYECPKSQTEVDSCASHFPSTYPKTYVPHPWFFIIEYNRFISVTELVLNIFGTINHYNSCRSQWPRGLRRSLWPLACCDRGFESHRVHGCLSVVSVVCCQTEVSASS